MVPFRIQTALQGQHEMQLETFEKLLESENDRLTLISLLSLA